MADWEDLKRAFEKELNKDENNTLSDEEKLLNSIANYLGGSKKDISVVAGYNTEEVLAFLEKPVSEIKTAIGGEWLKMDDSVIDSLVYTLTKKVKKSADFFG